ncbi:mutator protein [Hordeum vulgare]|nr:mutator protein [Hordeum vulgare]
MTVTLQDVSMITTLPIEGKPLCMSTDYKGWRQQMDALIGMSPPKPEVEDGGKKDIVPAGASFTWIAANFAHCPEDGNDEVIQTYARVYMWYVIARTIFADGTSKFAPWMWLKALTVFDNKLSWGLAALAYLYRQLDDAYRRSTKDSGVGGCMLLFSVWSWERLPVGRPKAATWKTWDDHGNPVRLPTWAYKWDVRKEIKKQADENEAILDKTPGEKVA